MAAPLPDPVVVALAIPGIDHTKFPPVLEALGELPVEGQVELAHRLVGARYEYIAGRIGGARALQPRALQKRLTRIGTAARRFRALLHQDKTVPCSWHPAVTLALPQLFRAASKRGSIGLWDPPYSLTFLENMLADLANVAEHAEALFSPFSTGRQGGRRRQGMTPSDRLIHQLIEIYEEFRARFSGSGWSLAFDRQLRGFVRAGLTFAVAAIWITNEKGERRHLPEAAYLESDLPSTTRTTDRAIEGVYRRRLISKRNSRLI